MIYVVTSYDLLRMPARPGQYYYATDVRCLYMDYDNEIQHRRRVAAVVLNSDYERLNSIRPQNGQNYYVIDTNMLWVFDTKWVLKVGDVKSYNSYMYDSAQPMTPVILNDSSITSVATGDKIIDNNGLLGNGSVVVRDANRINRGILGVDIPNSALTFTSFMDKGIVFYPYGMGSSVEEQHKTGSLSLGIEAVSASGGSSSLFNESISHVGRADYRGNLYIHGNIYFVDEVNTETDPYYISYYPDDDQEMIHSFIIEVQTDDVSNYNYVNIKVLSDTEATVRVISYTSSLKDVLTDDTGNPIYTSPTTLTSDIEYSATRDVIDDNKVTFTLSGVEHSFTLEGSPNVSLVTLDDDFLGNPDDNIIATTQLFNIIELKPVVTKRDYLSKRKSN